MKLRRPSQADGPPAPVAGSRGDGWLVALDPAASDSAVLRAGGLLADEPDDGDGDPAAAYLQPAGSPGRAAAAPRWRRRRGGAAAVPPGAVLRVRHLFVAPGGVDLTVAARRLAATVGPDGWEVTVVGADDALRRLAGDHARDPLITAVASRPLTPRGAAQDRARMAGAERACACRYLGWVAAAD